MPAARPAGFGPQGEGFLLVAKTRILTDSLQVWILAVIDENSVREEVGPARGSLTLAFSAAWGIGDQLEEGQGPLRQWRGYNRQSVTVGRRLVVEIVF